MRHPRFLFLALLVVCLCAFVRPAEAQTPVKLRVATRVVPPFVLKDEGGAYSGFSIELWEAIAKRLNVETQYQSRENVKDLLSDVQSKKADVAVAAISITAERDRTLDFSQPIYDSGLQILVRGNNAGEQPSVWFGLVQVLTSPLLRQFVIIALLLVLLPAHLVWFLERRHPEGIIRSKTYFPGIFEAVWWTISCLATQAEEMPKHTLSRVLAVAWMFFAVIFIAYVTAALTANLTMQQLRGDIRGPGDLPGKRVATVAGSTSAGYLDSEKIRYRAYPTAQAAAEALEQGNADAVVYDSPVLLYYAANEGNGHVQVVGPLFRREDYGIAVGPDSPWRKPINLALLTLKENGEYDRIYQKWFGQGDSSSSTN